MATPSATHKGILRDSRYGLLGLTYRGAWPGVSALGANTPVEGILVGTPVQPALAVDSIIVSNLVASGDFLLALNRGGNSENYIFADSSAGALTLYAPNGAITLTPTSDVVFSDGTGILLGSTTQLTTSNGDGATDMTPEFQVLGTEANDGSLVVAVFNTTNTRAVSPHIALVKGAAATQVATTAVADNEVIGSIIAYGSDSADFETPVGAIEFVVDDPGAPGAGAIGGSIEFYTTADGGETLTISFTVDTAQNIYVADANGIVIGNNAQVAVLATTAEFQVLGTAAADSSISIVRNSADASQPQILFAKSRNATIGSFTIITTGDTLGSISAIGDDGVDFNANSNAAAQIAFVSMGTIGADRIPGRILFRTATDAAPSVLTSAFQVDADQNIYILDNNGIVVGHTATVPVLGITSEVGVYGTGDNDASIAIIRNAAGTDGGHIFFAKSRNGTIGSFTIVTTGDSLGNIQALGDDGVDFNSNSSPSCRIEFVATGTIAADRVPGEIRLYTATDAAPSVSTERIRLTNAGVLAFTAGSSIGAASSTEIAISVTNDAITVGSEGSLIIPYLSSTAGAFTDAVGGNVNGCVGLQNDTDAGPVRTFEARFEGSWLSVAMSGYLHQRNVPIDEHSPLWFHQDQLHYSPNAEGKRTLMIDESRCVVCGEPLEVGQQVTFWVNGRYEAGSHSVFGHTHLERDELIQRMERRIAELEHRLGLAHKEETCDTELVAA